MSRLKAFSLHLTISAAIAASVIALMLLVWYAPPFFTALGGSQVLLILLGVDVTLGPLFTLIIFNPLKSRRALRFDLSVIAILQSAALLYGMNVVFEARPVFVVFSRDSFDLVTANMLSSEDIAAAKYPGYRSLPLTGPVYVYTEMPGNIKDRNDVVMGTFSSGKDLPQFPQYYQPYDEHSEAAGKESKPIEELRKLNPQRVAQIDASVHASGRAEAEIGYLPLRAKEHDQAVLVGKSDGKILALIEANAWPNYSDISPNKH